MQSQSEAQSIRWEELPLDQVSIFESLNNVSYVSFQNGTVVLGKSPKCVDHGSLADRGEISVFTRSSRKRMAKFLRNTVANYRYIVTLTYPGEFESDGSVVKDHLRRFIQEHRRECVRLRVVDMEMWGVFWFLEFQRRGAPHFHLFTTSGMLKPWLSATWYRVVGSGDERHLAAGTNIQILRETGGFCGNQKPMISYAMKYAKKMEQKAVPAGYEKVGRFWGISGCRRTVTAHITIEQKHKDNPHFQRKFGEFVDQLRALTVDGRPAAPHQKYDASGNISDVAFYARAEVNGSCLVFMGDPDFNRLLSAAWHRFILSVDVSVVVDDFLDCCEDE